MQVSKYTCRTKPGLLIAAIFCVVLWSPQYAGTASQAEQLIVFVQPDVSPAAKSFQQHQLPQIRKLAQTLGVDLHVVDARKGSPSTVGITPLIVYQNHRGRSIYQGRTTTPERIRNFIRTSRFVPQGKEPNRRENIPVWQEGRARVWAPLKVAAVTGSPPKDYNNDKKRRNSVGPTGAFIWILIPGCLETVPCIYPWYFSPNSIARRRFFKRR
jgi:hypothetical protein